MTLKILVATVVLLTAGCTATTADKTPQTESGKLNSCMLSEIYDRRDKGSLPADEWTAAADILNTCLNRLDMRENLADRSRSINIAASVIRSLQTPFPAREKE